MSARLHPGLRWLGCVALGVALISGCGSGGSTASQGPSVPSGTAPSATASPRTSSTPGTAPPTPAAPRPLKPSPTPPPPAKPPTKPPTTPAPFPARLAGTDFERIPTSRHVIALTFDAGANADAVSSILATLGAEHVPATFFLTGDFVNQFPAAARQIAAAQRVGNHSMRHPYFTALTPTQITGELAGARDAIRAVTGADPRPLFRFPYGDRNAATIAAVNAAGYVPVRWTVDTLGWKGTSGGITAQTVRDRVINALQPGEIVLMHCGSNPTDHTTLDAVALGGIIETVKAMGYGFVTLDALLTAQ